MLVKCAHCGGDIEIVGIEEADVEAAWRAERKERRRRYMRDLMRRRRDGVDAEKPAVDDVLPD